jgi:transposase-like protein
MSRSTISTFKLFELFPDNETARLYLEDRLWPNGPVCPDCKSGERITVRKDGFYRCNACGDFDFTIRTGTVFERSKVPLHKWVYSMYLLVTARKGISSMQLAKEIGVTQKTAWFILGRLREACSAPDSIDIPVGLPFMEFRWDGKSTEGSDHCPILDLVEVSA